MMVDTKTIGKIFPYLEVLLSDADLPQVINDFSDMNDALERVIIQTFITKLTAKLIDKSFLFRFRRVASSSSKYFSKVS